MPAVPPLEPSLPCSPLSPFPLSPYIIPFLPLPSSILSALFPLPSFNPPRSLARSLTPLDLLEARNPTNCRQSHICRSLGTILTFATRAIVPSLIPRMCTRSCIEFMCACTHMSVRVYELLMLRDVNQVNGLSAAAR